MEDFVEGLFLLSSLPRAAAGLFPSFRAETNIFYVNASWPQQGLGLDSWGGPKHRAAARLTPDKIKKRGLLDPVKTIVRDKKRILWIMGAEALEGQRVPDLLSRLFICQVTNLSRSWKLWVNFLSLCSVTKLWSEVTQREARKTNQKFKSNKTGRKL